MKKSQPKPETQHQQLSDPHSFSCYACRKKDHTQEATTGTESLPCCNLNFIILWCTLALLFLKLACLQHAMNSSIRFSSIHDISPVKSTAFRNCMLSFLHSVSAFHRNILKIKIVIFFSVTVIIHRDVRCGETIFFYHWIVFIKYLERGEISKFITITTKLMEAEGNLSTVWSITQQSQEFSSCSTSGSRSVNLLKLPSWRKLL